MTDEERREQGQLLLLDAPDDEAVRALRRRAQELGCTLSRLPDVVPEVPGLGDGDAVPGLGDGDAAPRLEDAAALCRALLDGTRDKVLVADEDGEVTFVSHGLAALAGTTAPDAVGRPADLILEAIDLPTFERLRGMLSRVSCARMEAEVVDPSGVTHPVLLRGVSTTLDSERRRFIWFITELTRVRSVERANRILRSELETQSRLLALVSHELRTPLNIVLGQLALLKDGVRGELSDEQRDSVERAERAGRSLVSLINDLIDFARLEAQQLEMEIRTFSLEELVREVAATAEALLSGSGRATVVRRVGLDGDDRVRGDPARTRQILLKLLTNAVKFTDRGPIHVELRSADERETPAQDDRPGRRYLVVDVRDAGEGVPRDQLEEVFQPFRQASRLLNRDREGTGLGLAIARRLARRQGGDLVAARNGERGSTFSLILPAAD